MSEFQKWWQNDGKNNFTATAAATVTFRAITKNFEQQQQEKENNFVNSDEYFKLPEFLFLFGNDNNNNNNTSNEILKILYDDDKNNKNSYNNLNSTNIIFLITLYSLVIFLGVLGNAALVITITSSARLRNPLLVSLCLADLIVTGLSAPISLTLALMTQKTWSLESIGCKIIHYLQSMPIAASTFSFFILSMDRYATVRHPNIAQLRQRRYVHTILALLSWLLASIICIPIVLAYNIFAFRIISNNRTAISHNNPDSTLIPYFEGGLLLNNYFNQKISTCRSEFSTSFIIIHTLLVFIVPGLGVILNHYGVRRKLCALSLTARAQHGELPLPMPILRRPTHMIIVTGMANAAGVCGNDSSDEEKNIDNTLMNKTIIKSRANPKSPRVMRELRVQQRKQKSLQKNKPNPTTTAGIPLPQTSTLRSRRRLANILIFSALLFCGCWSPHVFCILRAQLGHKQYCSKIVSYYSLLLGYSHSVISPIIYWILNHNSLRQSACAPFFVRFGAASSLRRFVRSHFRPTVPDPPSSTNEAALGAFNPRYIKTTKRQYRAQASSHYLY